MANTFTEPEWGIPQEAIEKCSSFHTGGPSPFLLSGVFLRLLQYHFSSANNIDEHLLKGYIWTPSTGVCAETVVGGEGGSSQIIPGSRLLIRPDYSQAGPAGQLPAIYIKREAFKTNKVSLGNKELTSLSRAGLYEGETYRINITGSHTIVCAGATGAESELLGQEVFFRMLHYQQLIKKDFCLGSLQVLGVSDVKARKETAKTSFYTVVRLEWAYVYGWKVIPESAAVKRIAFEYREQ